MRYFATRQQALRYGRRMTRLHGAKGFTVQQVESGQWLGYWVAIPEKD